MREPRKEVVGQMAKAIREGGWKLANADEQAELEKGVHRSLALRAANAPSGLPRTITPEEAREILGC